MMNFTSATKTPISSSNRNSVLLHRWWLIKLQGDSKLGVGGYVNRETLGSRGRRLLGSASFGKIRNLNTENQTVNKVFCSTPIRKRVDNNTLETIDGITIMITGSIHQSRTLSYGFSPEVCDHFLSGFPFDWEEYPDKISRKKCETSFNDLPVTWAREILMSNTQESETCDFTSMIVNDILKQCTQDTFTQTEVQLDHKQDDNSLKGTEEAHEINSFPVEDLGNSKEQEAARISSRAGSLCESRLDPKRKQCDTSRLLEGKGRYPLRHKQIKKNK